MRISLLLSSALLLSGCGREEVLTCVVDTSDPRAFSEVDPEFAPYLADFETYLGHEVVDIPMGFKKLNRPRVGECRRWVSGKREIAVDPDWWKKADPLSRQELVFHELGHCALNRPHSEEVDEDKWPVSIMWPSVFSGYLLDNYRFNFDRYVTELFSTVK